MRMVQPLTAAAFEPFGEVLTVPDAPGRVYFERMLRSERPGAWPSLSLSRAVPLPSMKLRVETMERHASSQSFVPLGPARFIALVAPHAAAGGPDMERAMAFLAGPGQGVTYAIDTWDLSMTVLDVPTNFAIFVWRDGTATDEEFVPVTPFDLMLG